MPKKPVKKQEGEQKKLTLEEYERKVIELADKGLTAEKIGEELKKNGIHSKEYEKKISKILKDKYDSPDLKNTEKKLEKIEQHLKKNKQDKKAKRERSRVFSQIRKIKKYLKKL
jgi:ribosomal protein S15P/S13E